MFVLDGAKARLLALIIALAAAVPFFPRVKAVEKPRAVAEETEAKAPSKTKRTKAKKKAHGDGKVYVRSIGFRAVSPLHWTKRVPHEPDRTDVQIVLAAARAQIGKPYRWAGAGPRTFDCSGLTMFVWRKVGVELPHNSSAQYAATEHVGLAKAKPGDIVFMPHHVGIYIGHGRMIHAPRSGSLVEVAPVHGNAYGAGRPIVR